ncbi:hypothetical protein FDECE_14348 [Fusarium decemcellulare]|nr:hypothetical protein FDECE_14348 [Fusarium decemcellulare]
MSGSSSMLRGSANDSSRASQVSGMVTRSRCAGASLDPDKDGVSEGSDMEPIIDSCSEQTDESYREEVEGSSTDGSKFGSDSSTEFGGAPLHPCTPKSRQLNGTLYRIRRPRRSRVSERIARSGSGSDAASSPCSRLGRLGKRPAISQDPSLQDRLEDAILALDGLKRCLRGVVLEIGHAN